MFSAVGALYGTILPSRLQTFQCCLCAVHSRSLEGHSSWYDLCIGTMVTTTHISSQILPSVGLDLSAITNPREFTIYRSDGAYRGQGTIAETLAGWDAAVWSVDARGLGAGIDFATACGLLGNVYSNYQTESFALQCFVSSVSLAGPSRYFEVGSQWAL